MIDQAIDETLLASSIFPEKQFASVVRMVAMHTCRLDLAQFDIIFLGRNVDFKGAHTLGQKLWYAYFGIIPLYLLGDQESFSSFRKSIWFDVIVS